MNIKGDMEKMSVFKKLIKRFIIVGKFVSRSIKIFLIYTFWLRCVGKRNKVGGRRIRFVF